MSRLLFSKKNGPRALNSLDFKLVKKAQKTSVPGLTQIKYLFHFLSKGEKLLFNICFGVALLSLGAFAFLYLSNHFVRIPNEGGEYSEALIGQPKYINPLYASASDVDQDLTSLVYAGLFRHGDEGKIEPYIAESYTVSTDTKKYNIKLRTDVKFADGITLTASDVMFTIDLIQNPKVASPLLPTFQGVVAERVNDFEISLTLKTPFAPFLSALTVGILPEHIWGESGTESLRLVKSNLQPIGAGPWQFGKMIKDSSGRIDSLTLSRNDYYFEDKANFKTLRFKFFDEYTGALEALRSQSVDTISFLPQLPNLRLNNKNIIFHHIQLPEYTAIFFNQTYQPILKNDDVRLALHKAIDKNVIVNKALDGLGKIINSPILPGAIGYQANGKKIETNIDEANTLLDKSWTRLQPEEYFKMRFDAVLKEMKKIASSTPDSPPIDEQEITNIIRSEMDPSQLFYRKDKDGNVLQITITTADNEEYGKAAEAVAVAWQNVGVKTLIEKVSTGRLARESIKNRAYDVLLYGEIVGSDPDPFPFWHSSQTEFPGLNLAGYSDRNADKILEEARSAATNTIARAELYKKFEGLLVEQVPAIFLYTPLHTIAINKEIRGVNVSEVASPADRYADLSQWYIKTKLKWK